MTYSAPQGVQSRTEALAAHQAEHADIDVRQTLMIVGGAVGLFFALIILGCAFAPTIPLIG